MTQSADGMLWSSKQSDCRQFPTLAREVADVSGAGDTVVATLANVAAGLVVAKLGTATLTRAGLAAALEREAAGLQ